MTKNDIVCQKISSKFANMQVGNSDENPLVRTQDRGKKSCKKANNS